MPDERSDVEHEPADANVALPAGAISLLCLALLVPATTMVPGLVAILLLVAPCCALIAIAQAFDRRSRASRAARRAGGFLGVVTLTSMVVVLYVFTAYEHPSREGAKQRKSLNNIRQLAVAAQTYSQDYDGALPGWATANGREYHNVWDQQIGRLVRSKDVFCNGDTGIRSPSQPAPRDRVLTYGLNGLLIAAANAPFTGDADWSRPRLLRPARLISPETTILFAELATNGPMPAPYNAPEPPQTAQPGVSPDSRQYEDANPGWIDVDPRSFCEPEGGSKAASNAGHYAEPFRNTDWGIARNLYHGGGCYAFCDGHVQFMKISKTVGFGLAVNGRTITEADCWNRDNRWNMWIPK
ncbi:MAG TPA: hypothetical protein VGM37_03005 [Armatimonadota bacterium]|jgi:prepilin-type processing-associated H-X9-DG protein